MAQLPNAAQEVLDAIWAQLQLQLQDRGITPEKVLSYAALFLVLWVIYASYFKAVLDMLIENKDHGQIPVTVSVWKVLSFMLVEGWPFALMAYFSKSWSSTDTARVAMAAFVAAEILWCRRLGLNVCPTGLFFIGPLLPSAAIGHALGAWRHRRTST